MIQLTPQMRILVAVEPADFRRGIDGLARQCREVLGSDPFSGAAFVFRNRRGSAVKVLVYDGQGFWLCHKRLSSGRFRFWPGPGVGPGDGAAASSLHAHELGVLLRGGDPSSTKAAPEWRRIAAGS
jgi:transposase